MKSAIAGVAMAALARQMFDDENGPMRNAFPRQLSRGERIRLEKMSFKGSKRTMKAEDVYKSLIKAGLVKVVRRKGKPPLIVWL